jgi:predicted dehydrogenase
MEKIRCSIAGLGRIASLLEDDRLREKPATHAGAISGNRECVLFSGCDPDRRMRELFRRRWRCEPVFPDLAGLLAHGVPDILSIASPPETHLALAGQAVAAGVPVIVCEKPLALDLAEARAIVELAGKAGTILLVNHERRYSLDYRRAQERILAGTFGDLKNVTCRLHMGRNKVLGDMLFDDATHMLDILRFLLGSEPELLRVQGDVNVKGGSSVILLQSGDVGIVLLASCGREYLEFGLELDFTRGRIVIGNGIYEEYESVKSPYYENIKSLKKTAAIRFRKTGYFSGMFADAVRVFRDRTRKPVSSGFDGLKAVELLYGITGKAV